MPVISARIDRKVGLWISYRWFRLLLPSAIILQYE